MEEIKLNDSPFAFNFENDEQGKVWLAAKTNNFKVCWTEDNPNTGAFIATMTSGTEEETSNAKSYFGILLSMAYIVTNSILDPAFIDDFINAYNNMVERKTNAAKEQPQEPYTEDDAQEDIAVERIRQQLMTEEGAEEMVNEAIDELKRNTENK